MILVATGVIKAAVCGERVSLSVHNNPFFPSRGVTHAESLHVSHRENGYQLIFKLIFHSVRLKSRSLFISVH